MSAETDILPTFRLSVIVLLDSRMPGPRRAWAERAVQSIFKQSDPIGTEVILAEDGAREDTLDYFRTAFAEQYAQGRLQIPNLARKRDQGATLNEAAQSARGAFLAVLDSEDHWLGDRLQKLEPLLRGHDLLIESIEPPLATADWLQSFIQENWSVRSSAVMRRTLFDEIGGYPTGRLLRRSDYEWLLKALVRLVESDRRERLHVGANLTVKMERMVLPEALDAIQRKVNQVRDTLTAVSLGRKLPIRYWPTVARKLKKSPPPFG